MPFGISLTGCCHYTSKKCLMNCGLSAVCVSGSGGSRWRWQHQRGLHLLFLHRRHGQRGTPQLIGREFGGSAAQRGGGGGGQRQVDGGASALLSLPINSTLAFSFSQTQLGSGEEPGRGMRDEPSQVNGIMIFLHFFTFQNNLCIE